MFSFEAPRVVLTPCIGVCNLDADGVCEGCHRTRGEIAAWSTLPDGERLYIMNYVLPQREKSRA
jgi:predicted Fe-S protein YdhL (DUF1289 family)